MLAGAKFAPKFTHMAPMRNTCPYHANETLTSRQKHHQYRGLSRLLHPPAIQVQQLIRVYAQILRQADIDNRPLHISSDVNVGTDRWSVY